ncbi:hypothetical protein BgramDRAFT_5329 [Paraburkholderia graminis C4D1M]|uniref:Uncharacterized protein n=1 Tax=Paraburkholderia graminis (strain ATCC 700544 / DSM 17151 / LMG 18924 / NCIMB 13744 / C4D1M) TaxID=396598 RepID=B1G7K3_PARG4|nr:hypothetical protein BgramDRAFT_5329 [Paraburkholderia graminis C4D1M]
MATRVRKNGPASAGKSGGGQHALAPRMTGTAENRTAPRNLAWSDATQEVALQRGACAATVLKQGQRYYWLVPEVDGAVNGALYVGLLPLCDEPLGPTGLSCDDGAGGGGRWNWNCG